MKKFFAAVIAMMMTLGVSAQFYIYLSNGELLKADSISLVAPTTPNPPTPSGNGVLNGGFSVSNTKQVHFSQGNLQYQASSDTWRFAEHQWDMIGEDNSNISTSYTGWIDLFGGGTGSNPTLSSTDDSDYSTFTDWGVNAISNGGNAANQWRTLTYDEWNYLYNTRTNASNLRGQATVNGVHGYVLLADGFVAPSGLSFTASPNNWTTNVYTAEEWSQMEGVGAVFLPAAGRRNGTGMDSVSAYGFYWSSTRLNGYGDVLYFNEYGEEPMHYYPRFRGLSVRLVQDFE